MISRLLASELKSSKKSVLLLGPRQVGKSTLLNSLNPDLMINLADQEEYLNFQSDSSLLRRLISAKNPKTVFIDEIQRIPELTNTIQSIIDANKSIKFYLSGSSARKLKRGNANLLPGRLLTYKLGPIALSEIGYKISEDSDVSHGFLPEIFEEKSIQRREKLLKSYSSTYLKEEIQAEALVRSLPGFVRFLNEAAANAGRFLDFSKLATKAKIPRQSAVRHFEILEDTMIAHRITHDDETERLDLVKHPKYYFFDTGVLNGFLNNFIPSADRIGNLFEHTFVSQIFASSYAKDIDPILNTFRTRGGLEVDFIYKYQGRSFAIELKSSKDFSQGDISSLKQFKKIYPKKCSLFLAYRGKKEQKDNDIWILPWQKVISEIGL